MMTDKVLNEYFEQHKETYMSLARSTSVPEVLLKIEIYGKKWNQWDWVLFFLCVYQNLITTVIMSANEKKDAAAYELYKDLLDAIDNTSQLDKILVNRQVLLNMICVVNGNARFVNRSIKIELCTLLAHIFKKFPYLWKMSWMKAKYRNDKTKTWQKYHRMKSAVYITAHKLPFDPYYSSQKYYDDFINLYYPNSIKYEKDEEKQ